MQKIILTTFVLLITFSNNTKAKWIDYLKKANGSIYYYDNERIKKKANFIKVWSRIRFKGSVMGAFSYQSLIRIDCTKFTETTLQNTFFTDKNWKIPAMATNMIETSKIKISKSSHTNILLDKLCK